MIKEALTFLQQQVNTYVLNKTSSASGTEKVVLTSVVDDTGNVIIPADCIGVSLINVEEERMLKDQTYAVKTNDGQMIRRNPDIRLNLYVLFAVNPTTGAGAANKYPDGLALLSYVINYFQINPYFTHKNGPTMDPRIEKLIPDLYSFPLEEQHYMWATLGAKYLPSVVYRVRMVVIQEDQAHDTGPITTKVQIKLTKNE